MANKKANNTPLLKHTKEQSDDKKDYTAFKVVLFYCSLIVFLPVATFFLMQSVVLDRMFDITTTRRNIYSAVGAVVALHFALGLYIYRAYFVTSNAPSSYKKAD